jgi:hypothetical protein
LYIFYYFALFLKKLIVNLILFLNLCFLTLKIFLFFIRAGTGTFSGTRKPVPVSPLISSDVTNTGTSTCTGAGTGTLPVLPEPVLF